MADEYLLDVGQTYARYNLVENPSFEVDLTGWTAGGGLNARSTTDAYAGTASLRNVAGANTDNRVLYSGLLVVPDSPFRFSCWVKNAGGATRNMQLGANWDSGTDVLSTPVSVAAGGAWTRLELSGTIPATASTVQLQIYTQLTNNSTGNLTDIDAVLFELPYLIDGTIPSETFYFDYDTTVGVPANVYNPRVQWESESSAQTVCTYEKYTLDAVELQTVSLFVGKRDDTDSLTASSGSFTAWYPNGFTSPVADLLPGNPCRVRRVGNSTPLWLGRIRDVRVDWGMPWDGSVGNGDTLSIEVEGYLGEWGRRTEPITSLGGTVEDYFAYYILPLYGEWIAATGYNPTIIGTTNPIGPFEWLDYLTATFDGTVNDGNPVVQVRAYNSYEAPGFTFSTAANNATTQVFEMVNNSSLADNLYSVVDIVADGTLITQGFGDSRGRETTVNTLSATLEQADGLAGDFIERYGSPVYKITSVACRAEAQHTMNLDGGAAGWAALVGKRTTVTFRGATTDVRIQGLELTADPSTALYTFYFSAENPVEYFILDSSDYGVLDTNRLGW